MAGTDYLKQRRLGWYVQLAVPVALQPVIGRKVLVRSLATRDLAQARKRRHAVLAELQSIIAQAAARSAQPAEADLMATAETLRDSLDRGESTAGDVEAAFGVATDAYLDAQARRYGRDVDGHPRLPAAELAKVRRAHAAAAGRLDATLPNLVDRYLKESAEHLTAQSIESKRRALSAFVAWFGVDREAQEVTRTVAGTYVAEVIQKRTHRAPGAPEGAPEVPLAPATRRQELSALRSFFDWVMVRGPLDSNPFDRMASTVRVSTRGAKPKRRPWTAAELSTVLHGVPINDPVWSLTVLAAYSGMRREEVGELKASDVDGDMLLIEQGKTAAAVRRVPIHRVIAPLVRRLAKTTTDGYLIPGLLRGGADRKRAWYVGKRFGRIIRELGVKDPRLDFHALRHTVITQLEGAGVPESTIQLIVGHKRQGMTFGVYSGGVPDATKRAALAHLTYGKTLDAFVSKAGGKVNVTASARARKRV